MKTKTFYGVKFNVYTDSKIDGDFIKPDEAVYFENDNYTFVRWTCNHILN